MDLQLTHKEWEKINEIVIKMNREKDAWIALTSLLEDIEEIIPYEKADIILYSFSKNKYSIDNYLFRHFDEQEKDNYNGYYYQIDDILDKMKQIRMYVMRSSDVFDVSREETEYYVDHIKKTDIHYSLDANFQWHRNNKSVNFGSLDLFRSKKNTDFSEKEKTICEIIQPHIETKISHYIYSDDDYMNGLFEAYTLTQAENAVAIRMMHGDTNDMIAEELFITVSTVKKHISRILEKTQTTSRVNLISKLMLNHTE